MTAECRTNRLVLTRRRVWRIRDAPPMKTPHGGDEPPPLCVLRRLPAPGCRLRPLARADSTERARDRTAPPGDCFHQHQGTSFVRRPLPPPFRHPSGRTRAVGRCPARRADPRRSRSRRGQGGTSPRRRVPPIRAQLPCRTRRGAFAIVLGIHFEQPQQTVGGRRFLNG